MSDTITADELRQFIEIYEELNRQKQEIADQQKETLAEAKSRGFSVPIIREIIKLRKMRPDDLAEREAVLELYRSALGV